MGVYDLVVGIPSCDEADNIGYVAEMAGIGLQKYFPEYRSIIVNVDNNSQDNTRDAFLNAGTEIVKHYISTPEGVKGKGNNLWNLLNFVMDSGARVVVVLDADLTSVTPEWVNGLARPIEEGYHYVCPIYSTNQLNDSITNHICYPLTLGLLGMDIRQPNGGDFGFSREVCGYLLDCVWDESTRQHGVDIFMTLNAILGGFRIAQAKIGMKTHKARSPRMGTKFEQIINSFLDNLMKAKEQWPRYGIDDIVSPDIIGQEEQIHPQQIYFELRDLKSMTRAVYFRYRELIRSYLSDYAFKRIDKMIYMDYFELDTLLWTQVLYMLLYKFDQGSEQERKEIIDILKPLYFSRALSFDYQTWRHDGAYIEECLRDQAMAFAAQKPYLLGIYGM